MPQCLPHSGEFTEKLSVSNLLSIWPVIGERHADCVECLCPRSEVSQNSTSLARCGVPIEVTPGEAATAKLFGDFAELLHEDFARQRIDAPPVKTEVRTIHRVAPHAV